MSDDSSNNGLNPVAGNSVAIAIAETSTPRFSLRRLLAVVAIAACVFAGVAEFNRRSDQRAALLRIEKEKEAMRDTLVELATTYLRINSSDRWRRGVSWPPAIPVASDGTPLSSWRLQVSGSRHFGGPEPNYNAPWNSPQNLAYGQHMGELFCFHDAKKSLDTHVFGITGPDTAFDPNAVMQYGEFPPDLIVAMEVGNSNVCWLQPGDYDVRELLAGSGTLRENITSVFPDRIHVVFADTVVWALSPNTPMSAVQPFLTIAGAKSHDRNQVLAPFRTH